MRQVADFLLAVLAVALADVVLFHAGAYFPLLQPDSFSGYVENKARRLEAMIEASPGERRIVVMGNSMGEASIRESQLEDELAETGRRFQVINQATGGSSPRAWYVLLKNSRVGGGNTEVVVLAVHNTLLRIVRKARQQDVDIVKTRMKVTDALAVAGAYRDRERRLGVLAGAIFRTLLFRDDVRQALEDPRRRRRQLARARARFHQQMRKGARIDNGSTRDLLSARLGADDQLVFDELDGFLKGNAGLRRRIEHVLLSRRKTLRAMEHGRRTSARVWLDPEKAELLTRLVEHLNRDGVKVVLSVLPSGPYSLDRPPEVDHLGNIYRRLRQRGADVEMWHDRELLRRLHSPATYQDELHVNAKGAEIYTRGLGRFLASVLAGQN